MGVITKKRLLELLDEILDDTDSLTIDVKGYSDVRYVQKLSEDFPNTKLIQADDRIIITGVWGLKYFKKDR